MFQSLWRAGRIAGRRSPSAAAAIHAGSRPSSGQARRYRIESRRQIRPVSPEYRRSRRCPAADTGCRDIGKSGGSARSPHPATPLFADRLRPAHRARHPPSNYWDIATAPAPACKSRRHTARVFAGHSLCKIRHLKVSSSAENPA